MPDSPVISVVDDDEFARAGVIRLLRSLGFAAHAFSSAREFLDSPQLSATACVITDIQMPGMSGIDLHDALRARGRNTPFIFMTGYPDERIRAEGQIRGPICFLNKPLEGELLLRCVESALKAQQA